MNKRKLMGFVMAAIGGIILLANAAAYLFKWDYGKPALTAFGILFLGAGMAMVRRG